MVNFPKPEVGARGSPVRVRCHQPRGGEEAILGHHLGMFSKGHCCFSLLSVPATKPLLSQ